MRIRSILTAAALIAVAGGAALGAGQVQVELVGEGQGTAMAFQQWMKTLSQAGIANVRIRSTDSAGKVGVEVRGTGENPVYVVTGVVRSADELLMPSGRFRRGDVGRLATWLDELARLGPEDQREPLAAFGLTREQLEEVLKDLTAPVGLATQELNRAEAAEKIRGRLSLPLRIEASQATKLAASKVDADLSALSCGTALAYLLQPVGLGLVPRATDGGIVYALIEAQPGVEVWSIGWEAEKPWPELLPEYYELRNVNVANVSAATALQAIAGRLKVPVLVDRGALARHDIDPAKIVVSHPSARTTYSVALRKLLFQAGLKADLRVDEAGQPFLWVTSVKPG